MSNNINDDDEKKYMNKSNNSVSPLLIGVIVVAFIGLVGVLVYFSFKQQQAVFATKNPTIIGEYELANVANSLINRR